MAFDSGILRFGTHRFRYNPHRLSITKQRRLQTYPLASSKTMFQELGYEPMVIEGEGTLTGTDVMAQLAALEQLLEQPGSQLLGLPELAPMYCYFTRLEAVGKAGPKFLTYRFTFLEDSQRSAGLQPQARYLIAERGDTIVTVAARCGLTVEELLARNPSLSGQLELQEGSMLWLN